MPGNLPRYEEAVAIIRSRTTAIKRTTTVSLADSLGRIAVQPVLADAPYPRFDNSAVDGYLIGSAADAAEGSKLTVRGSLAAGGEDQPNLMPGAAARILTGARVPPGSYGVVMQEDVQLDKETIRLNGAVAPGANIRRMGTEFNLGQILIEPGTSITPGVTSLYAVAGQTSPIVFETPKVVVLTTGDELVPPSIVPTGSQIRDTNSIMLSMLAGASSAHLADDFEAIRRSVKDAANANDLILIAGGASVGDRDYVGRVVEDLGEIYFHGVSIRPGKPILFGRVGESLVFGLPGNPTSAFVGFHIFANYALRILSGRRDPALRWLPMETNFEHKACGRTDCARVQFRDGKATLAREQGSFGLTSPASADGIAMFPPDVNTPVGYRCPVLTV